MLWEFPVGRFGLVILSAGRLECEVPVLGRFGSAILSGGRFEFVILSGGRLECEVPVPGRFGSAILSGGLFPFEGLVVEMAPRLFILNWPGRGVAAISGLPWFTEASNVRFDPAASW